MQNGSRIKVTAKACEAAKPDPTGKDALLGIGDGLWLRTRATGTKTWIVDYEIKGRRRKFTLGVFDPPGAPGESITAWLTHGRLSLAQARAIAGQWKADRRAGRDPVGEWEARLAAVAAAHQAEQRAAEIEAQQPTVQDASDKFMAKQITGKKSAEAIRYRLDRLSEIVGGRKIRDLSRQDVIAAIERIAEGRRDGRTAKQLAGEVLMTAKRLWHFAETRGWVEASCIKRLARQDFDASPRKRSVVLGLDEVAELWRALGDPLRCKADPVTVAAMRVLILTGQREREVTDAEWPEFDLDSALWKIPANRTKASRAHLVHLSPLAVAILTELREKGLSDKFVFPSPRREDQPIFGRSVNNALLLMFKRGVLPNVTHCHVHDLRRTLITRLPDLGFEPFIGHKIANHVLPGILAHYNHNEYMGQRKAALLSWAERIELLANAANVVPFRRAAA